jgi:acetyl esterase/lipase
MIAAGGGSAGGHLAACTALVPGFEAEGEDLSVSSKPNALVLFNPVVDVKPFDERFGGSKLAKKASPIYYVNENAPPTVIYHGASDQLVDSGTILEYQDLMKKKGAYCEVILFGGERHGFFNQHRSDGLYFKRTMALMEIFLEEQGYIK